MTLIELMIALVVVGILAAIALPSYQNQMMQSRRADVQNQLMQLHLQQGAWRLENPAYASAVELDSPTHEFYALSVADISATTFTLSATAKGAQTDDTGCTLLTIDQSMNKSPADCW